VFMVSSEDKLKTDKEASSVWSQMIDYEEELLANRNKKKPEVKSVQSLARDLKKWLADKMAEIGVMAKAGAYSTLLSSLDQILRPEFSMASNSLAVEIRSAFMSGSEKAETEFDRNFVPDQEALNFLQNYNFNLIKNISNDLKENIRATIERGVLDGSGPATIARNLKPLLDGAENRAEAIARTELNRAQSQGELLATKQFNPGSTKYLDIVEDSRTSPICKALNKKYGTSKQAIPLDQNFKVSVKVGKRTVVIDQDAPPFHVACRTGISFT